MHLLPRFAALTALTVALLVVGLVGPAAGAPAPVIPTTAARTLDGLPASGHKRLSAATPTPIPFSMVGFEIPEGTEIEFRTSTDGKRWSDWTEAEGDADEGPDPGTPEARAARVMTDPVWVGEATQIQTRQAGPEASARPDKVRVELIDSKGLSRSLGRRVLDRLRAAWNGTPPPAQAAPGMPPIVTRKQWGADEGLRRGSPYYASKITMGVVHHTAGSNDYSQAEAPAVMRGIYRYHTQSRGWSDIGYNLLIDRYGTIYEGRAGGIRKPVIGAHSGGFNTGTFGVSLIGTFDRVSPPKAMRAALEQLLAWKYDIHHVDVTGTTTYTSYGSTRYSAGQRVTLSTLSGHKDVSSTACPGAKLYPLLPTLRSTVAELQGPVLLDPSASPSSVRVVNGTSVDGGVTFAARLRPAGAWTLEVTDPAGTVVHAATGFGEQAASQWVPVAAERGTYRYTFSSPERRSAQGTIQLAEPAITATADPTVARIGRRGNLPRGIDFSAQLYPNASWRLSIMDPAGDTVHSATGTSATLATAWDGPTAGPGVYTWTLTADDVTPVTGSLELFANRVGRAGTSPDAVRAATALSKRAFSRGSARHAVITRGDRPAFAMAAGPLAGQGGPVLYTGAASLPADTLDELRRVLPAGGTGYVVGGRKVIDDTVVTALGSTWTVQRVGSKSPVKTAAAVADVVLAGSGQTTALVVGHGSATAWRQGFAAPAYGAYRGFPVLLTRSGRLPVATRAALARNGITSTIVVGNTTAVSDAVRAALPSAVRVAGKSQARTATAVASRLFARTRGDATDAFVFANTKRGDGWERALAAAPLAAKLSAPILTTARHRVPAATRRYLDGLGYSPQMMGEGTALGRKAQISPDVKDALSRHLQ